MFQLNSVVDCRTCLSRSEADVFSLCMPVDGDMRGKVGKSERKGKEKGMDKVPF